MKTKRLIVGFILIILGIGLYFTVFSSKNKVRTLELLIVADQGYQEQVPSWQKETEEFIDQVSTALNDQVKIKLKIISFKSWYRDSREREENSENSSCGKLLYELSKAFPKKKNSNLVVVGLTSHTLENRHGVCWIERGYILINAKQAVFIYDPCWDRKIIAYFPMYPSERREKIPFILFHEIGHLFIGKQHCLIKNCAMNAEPDFSIKLKLCKNCIKKIKKQRWKKF